MASPEGKKVSSSLFNHNAYTHTHTDTHVKKEEGKEEEEEEEEEEGNMKRTLEQSERNGLFF